MDPEAQAQEIMDSLYGLAGNAGQVAILDNGSDGFIEWAAGAIEDEDPPDDMEMVESLGLRPEVYDVTDEIWDEGFSQVEQAWANNQDPDADDFGDEGGGGGRGGRGREREGRGRERSAKGERNAARNIREHISRASGGGGRGGGGARGPMSRSQQRAMFARLRESGAARVARVVVFRR